jgi:hypothetical protein
MGLEILGAVQQAPQPGRQWTAADALSRAGVFRSDLSDSLFAINFVAFLLCFSRLEA